LLLSHHRTLAFTIIHPYADRRPGRRPSYKSAWPALPSWEAAQGVFRVRSSSTPPLLPFRVQQTHTPPTPHATRITHRQGAAARQTTRTTGKDAGTSAWCGRAVACHPLPFVFCMPPRSSSSRGGLTSTCHTPSSHTPLFPSLSHPHFTTTPCLCCLAPPPHRHHRS
jgi:hypothetical protein